MQTRHPDASQRFISLDDVYYYGGGVGVLQVAEKVHEPRNDQEIELLAGDTVHLAGNHWNGMSKGTNRRTNRVRIQSPVNFQIETVVPLILNVGRLFF